jgi:translation initiation factor 3 subunit F
MSSSSSSSSASSSSSTLSTPSLLGVCTSPSHSSFFLSITPLYRVHPLVIFSILDHYQRRPAGQSRVVGTLLGCIQEGGAIEVKQAFPVPHSEEIESATVQLDYHHSMVALHNKVAPKDVVVGWYSTSGSNESSTTNQSDSQLNYVTSLIHEMYRSQMPNNNNNNSGNSSNTPIEPVHISVDVSMKGGMKISGWVNEVIRSRPSSSSVGSSSSSSSSTDILSNFHPVPVEMWGYEEEKIGVDALISGVPDNDKRLDAPATFLSDAENIEAAIASVVESIGELEGYIARVVAGKVEHPNAALALQIHSLLSGLPTLDAATFQSTFATHIQDILAVVYLANMTKNQLAIADKANMLL